MNNIDIIKQSITKSNLTKLQNLIGTIYDEEINYKGSNGRKMEQIIGSTLELVHNGKYSPDFPEIGYELKTITAYDSKKRCGFTTPGDTLLSSYFDIYNDFENSSCKSKGEFLMFIYTSFEGNVKKTGTGPATRYVKDVRLCHISCDTLKKEFNDMKNAVLNGQNSYRRSDSVLALKNKFGISIKANYSINNSYSVKDLIDDKNKSEEVFLEEKKKFAESKKKKIKRHKGISVKINKDTDNILNELSEKENITKSDIIEKALKEYTNKI